MKCPKCGFNSFEHYDTCKKCSHDLTGYKQKFGLQTIVSPKGVHTLTARALMAGTVAASQPPAAVETVTDIFSFDRTGDEIKESPAIDKDNLLDLDKEAAATAPPGESESSLYDEETLRRIKADEEVFASLLESTSLEDVKK